MVDPVPTPAVSGVESATDINIDPKVENPIVEPDEVLGEAGKKALAAERKAARDAQRQLAEANARLQAIEDAGKSELEKALDKAAKAELAMNAAKQEVERERIARKFSLSDEDTDLLTGDVEQMERLAARIAQAATPPVTPPVGLPPVPGVGKVPDTRNVPIHDQIAAAEKAGEKDLVAVLKAMQLASTPAAS